VDTIQWVTEVEIWGSREDYFGLDLEPNTYSDCVTLCYRWIIYLVFNSPP
jgi:hypothetical protein